MGELGDDWLALHEGEEQPTMDWSIEREIMRIAEKIDDLAYYYKDVQFETMINNVREMRKERIKEAENNGKAETNR